MITHRRKRRQTNEYFMRWNHLEPRASSASEPVEDLDCSRWTFKICTIRAVHNGGAPFRYSQIIATRREKRVSLPPTLTSMSLCTWDVGSDLKQHMFDRSDHLKADIWTVPAKRSKKWGHWVSHSFEIIWNDLYSWYCPGKAVMNTYQPWSLECEVAQRVKSNPFSLKLRGPAQRLSRKSTDFRHFSAKQREARFSHLEEPITS